MNTVENVQMEMENGRKFDVEITIKWIYEKNYGADIDGNRGTPVWFVDDSSWEIQCEIWKKIGKHPAFGTPTEEIMHTKPRFQVPETEIQRAVDQFLENGNFDPPS